jgi:WD40 repeat protein
MENENILKLILSSYSQFEINKILLYSTNKTINIVTLKIINYEHLYKSLGQNNTTLQDNGCQVTPFCLISNGNLIARTWGNKLKIWDMHTCKTIKTFSETHSEYIQSIILLPNGNICSSSHDGEIKIWDNMKCIKTVYLENYIWFYLRTTLPNGHLICTGFKDGYCITILDLNNDLKCLKIIKEENPIHVIANISQNRFAAGSIFIKVWEAINLNYECVYNLSCHKGVIYFLLYDERKQFLISGSYDFSIKIWDVKNNFKCIKTITDLSAAITSMLLLPGGYFVSSTTDKVIKVWSLKSFLCVSSFKSEIQINSLLLLNDYRIVSSTAKKDEIIIWEY